MASIRLKTNIAEVSGRIREKLKIISDREYLLRPVINDLIVVMHDRIHSEGKAADEGQIGTYSKGYMAVRTGKFKNATIVKKGKKKGLVKSAGVFTKGENKGKPRPKYNRTDDTKIIVSLTRQLEGDWALIGTEKGYGIGFNNSSNLEKARWVEANKKKKIFSLSDSEQSLALEGFQEQVKKALES